MPSDYSKIQKALDTGAEPVMLCSMCSWDVNCVDPPAKTKGDFRERVTDLIGDFDKAVDVHGLPPGMESQDLPRIRGQITSVLDDAVGRIVTESRVCPVLALRLASAEGRDAVDGFKRIMRGEA